MFTHGDITDVSNYIHYGDISIYNIVYSYSIIWYCFTVSQTSWAELYSKLHVDRTAELQPSSRWWIFWKDVWSILLIEKHPANQFFFGSFNMCPSNFRLIICITCKVMMPGFLNHQQYLSQLVIGWPLRSVGLVYLPTLFPLKSTIYVGKSYIRGSYLEDHSS